MLPTPALHYRELRGYRYVVAEVFRVAVPELAGIVFCRPGYPLQLADGWLTICAGYAWDGVSGPARNTPATRKPGCVHDALYQLIRLGVLGREHRVTADWILYRIFRQTQRPWALARLSRRARARALAWIEVRALYYLAAVRFGGRRHTEPRKVEPQDQVYIAP